MLRDRTKLDSDLVVVQGHVIDTLNRSIGQQVTDYLAAVTGTEEELYGRQGPFDAIEGLASADLDKRRQKLIKAMPQQHETASTATTGAGGHRSTATVSASKLTWAMSCWSRRFWSSGGPLRSHAGCSSPARTTPTSWIKSTTRSPGCVVSPTQAY